MYVKYRSSHYDPIKLTTNRLNILHTYYSVGCCGRYIRRKNNIHYFRPNWWSGYSAICVCVCVSVCMCVRMMTLKRNDLKTMYRYSARGSSWSSVGQGRRTMSFKVTWVKCR